MHGGRNRGSRPCQFPRHSRPAESKKILAKKILSGTRPSPTQGHDDPDKFTELPLRTALAVLLRMASSMPLPSSASCRRGWPRASAPTSSGRWPR